MRKSTLIMPCNASGLLTQRNVSKFGIVDYDWSNAKELWANSGSKPMDVSAALVRQAITTKVKASSPTSAYTVPNGPALLWEAV